VLCILGKGLKISINKVSIWLNTVIGTYIKGTFPAFRFRNYRLFFFGQCISLIGTWMQNIGQNWLILDLTKDKAQQAINLATITGLQFLPITIFSLFAGTLVDKLPKRKVLIFTQVSLMILAFLLATITFLKIVAFWQVAVLAMLLGTINALDIPTRQSFVIELVDREALPNAIALNSSIFNLARIIGPGFAGLLIGFFGIAVCFYINSFSFIAVILGLTLMTSSTFKSIAKDSKIIKGSLSEIKEGLRYISKNRNIWIPIGLIAVINIFIINYTIFIPYMAKVKYNQGALGYGFMMTMMGIGSFLASVVLAIWINKNSQVKPLILGAMGVSILFVSLNFVNSYYIACILIMIAGFFSVNFTTNVNTTIQLNSDDHMRGRVMSVFSFVFGGLTPLGSLYAGKAIELIGIDMTLVVSGSLGIVFTVIAIVLYSKKAKLSPKT
jgi:MFS family permease